MLLNILYGMVIGIVNIIPGVSGGTMIVILGIFDKLFQAIAKPLKKENLFFLSQIGLGLMIGLVGFAKIIEFLFDKYATQTIFWFVGLIIFSIPILVKNEMKETKLKSTYFLLGLLIILIISLLAPDKTDMVIEIFPTINLLLIIKMIILGIIAGAATIFPGISGSMVLLILGEYYLYKSYLANVTTFDLNVLVPLFWIGLGILVGVIGSCRLTNYLLKNHRAETMSLILGLVIMSILVLIPINEKYNLSIILSSIGTFALGGIMIIGLERIKKSVK